VTHLVNCERVVTYDTMLYASILGPLMQTVDYFETGGTMQKVVQL